MVVKKMFIIGAGFMGTGIAQNAAADAERSMLPGRA